MAALRHVVGITVGDRVSRCVFALIWGLGETCVDMRGRELEWKMDSGIRVWVWDGVKLGVIRFGGNGIRA